MSKNYVQDQLNVSKNINSINNTIDFNITVTPYSIAISPTDNSRIASGWSNCNVEIWKYEDSSIIKKIMGKERGEQHVNEVKSVAWRPDGNLIISGSMDNTIIGWEANSTNQNTYGNRLFTLVGHTQPILSVAFSPDSNYIASGGLGKSIHVWNAVTYESLYKLGGIFNRDGLSKLGHNEQVNSVAFSPNSQYIASGSNDGTIKIWEFKQPKKNVGSIRTLESMFGRKFRDILSVAFSDDGKKLVSVVRADGIMLWGLDPDPRARPIYGMFTRLNHPDDFLPYSVAVYNKYIVGGADNFIGIWNQDGNLLHKLKGLEGNIINSVTVSKDGNYIAASSYEGIIKRWDLTRKLTQSGGKKKKLIDRFKKSDLIKIAKMHNLSLKTRDDKVKTKLQLFRSLKRKNLI
jgi:WD40 repeat protein